MTDVGYAEALQTILQKAQKTADPGRNSPGGPPVAAQPPGGGTHRPEGAQFVHLVGRPYRMNHDALRANAEYVLEQFFLEPYGAVGTPATNVAPRLDLRAGYPNPFTPRTTIAFSLPSREWVELGIYDVSGRLVRVLMNGHQPAGEHSVAWSGTDATGHRAASGVYYVRLRTADGMLTRPLVLTR